VRPRPNQYTIPGALIVLFHPSGWFVPSTAKLIPYARGLATLFNATVFCPQYRLAPEYPFPIGINDAWASVHWALQNLSSLGANPTKGFILGGISTGANFAVALARRAVETQLQPPVTGIWAPLYIGMRDGISVPNAYKADFTSRDENTNAMVMNVDQVGHLYAHYKPDFASPLFNPLVDIDNGAFDLSKMPRTHLQIAGADYFRDDGIVLAYALEDHGVDVKLDLYPGMPHSFWLFAPEVTTSKKCLKDIVAGFAYLLNVEVEDLPEGWATLLSSMGCQPNLTMKDGGKRGSIEVKLRH
jgi:acetyl esterase/lipase